MQSSEGSSSKSNTVQVLTNGSFVSLKDIPSGCSEEGSARLTASTGTDDSGSSDTSSGSGLASAGDYNNIGQSEYITIDYIIPFCTVKCLI